MDFFTLNMSQLIGGSDRIHISKFFTKYIPFNFVLAYAKVCLVMLDEHWGRCIWHVSKQKGKMNRLLPS